MASKLDDFEWVCCSKDCWSKMLKSRRHKVVMWQRAWARLKTRDRQKALLRYIHHRTHGRHLVPAVDDSPELEEDPGTRFPYTFLEQRVCRRSFHELSGIGRGSFERIHTWSLRGIVDPPEITRSRDSPVPHKARVGIGERSSGVRRQSFVCVCCAVDIPLTRRDHEKRDSDLEKRDPQKQEC